MSKYSERNRCLLPLFFRWSIENCAKYWWWLWWWHFLAMWETTQKYSRNCAQFELFGEDLPSFASFWKQRFCCAGLAGRHPRRGRSGTSLTHQCFVNNYTRSLQRESVNAQFLLSNISDNISHQDWCSKWMMDEWVSSGNIFSKLNLTKFDKINFQKSWHQTLMLTKSWWGRPINSWKLDISVFSSHPKMLDKDFVSLRLESFSNSPRVHCKRDHLPSSLHIPASNLKQACSSECNEGTYFDKTAL